jgi:hypothetical protein
MACDLQSILAAKSLEAIYILLGKQRFGRKNIVAGVVLQAWDAFDEGDDIQLGVGTERDRPQNWVGRD